LTLNRISQLSTSGVFQTWLEKSLRKLYEEVKNPEAKICLYNSISNNPSNELILGSFENMLPLFQLIFYASLINGFILIVEVTIWQIVKKYQTTKYRIINVSSHSRVVSLL
jgi:hypothetical protein